MGSGREDILAIHEALEHLAKMDARQAQVVEMRFFGGLTVDETAEVLKISPQSVMRDWKLAKVWLRREIWLRTWKWTARAEPAAGASRWEKNARNNRCHRDSSGARHGRRPHHRTEMDPQDDGEDRTGSPRNRHSGLGQHRCSSLVPNGFLSAFNRKQIATNSTPYRDQQFQQIGSLRTRFQRQGLPFISVDSKKRELIGNFKNTGAKWDRSPVLVNDHDFRSDASGVGISYGVYDPPHNRGTVCVGISHDTPGFAAHSIATWWKREGARRWGRAPRLLVPADSGGSNSCRSWAWRTEIQARVCNAFGFTVTVAHYPTGASKWNPIEHRLFSEISKNWARATDKL